MSTDSIFGTTRHAERRRGSGGVSPRTGPLVCVFADEDRDRDELARDLEDAFSRGLEDGLEPDAIASSEPTEATREAWIGVDLARWATAPSSRTWLPLVVLALTAALAVAALRMDLIRTRYALADVTAREEALLAEQRELLARRRTLRDPTELARLARERGFGPVAAVRVLDDPMPGDGPDAPILPDVAAPPAATSAPVAATLAEAAPPARVDADASRR